MKRSGFKRKRYPGQPATSYAFLRNDHALPLSTKCGKGEAQPKPQRWRSRPFLDWVRSRPCAYHGEWCREMAREASHHNPEGHGIMGAKPSDERAIPLCWTTHRRFHETGRVGDLEADETRSWVEDRIHEQLAAYTGPIPDYVEARYGLGGE